MTATLVEQYRPSREAGLPGSRAKSLTPRRPAAAALLLPRARLGFMLLGRIAIPTCCLSSGRHFQIRISERAVVNAQCVSQALDRLPGRLPQPLLNLEQAPEVYPRPLGQLLLREPGRLARRLELHGKRGQYFFRASWHGLPRVFTLLYPKRVTKSNSDKHFKASSEKTG